MKSGRFVVVEGYTDVLALHQAGIREAVAIMGTAHDPGAARRAREGRRLERRGAVFLALDADRAGREAMLRAARLAEDRGVDLRVVDMPEGTDPADLLQARRDADCVSWSGWTGAPMIEFQVRRVLADADLDTPSGRDEALEEARKLISAVPERTATQGRARPRSRGPPRRSRGLRAGPAPGAAVRRGAPGACRAGVRRRARLARRTRVSYALPVERRARPRLPFASGR